MNAERSLFRARWVLPIAQPPIRDGWVEVENGIIRAVGASDALMPRSPDGQMEAILPGLVNAHTHLELSYLHERIPPAPSFGVWVRSLLGMRSRYHDPSDPAVVHPALESIDDAVAAGTVLFGDVSNTLVTVPLLRERGIAAQVFYELIGFTEPDPEARVRAARTRADDAAGDDVRVNLAPHAPYSVSPGLLKAIRADVDVHADAVSSVHLAETPEEVQFLQSGGGEIREVLEALGRWPADWRPPGVGPVRYLADLGILDRRMLVVHGVQFGFDDLRSLKALGVTVVSCPRSNVHVGAGSPPLESFYGAGLDVALGTDSLASVTNLNLFEELKEARRVAPSVPARALLRSATAIGAHALGFGLEFGTIEPGKRAALIAVTIPEGVSDVEEYLVGGVQPRDVRWLAAR